MIHPGSFPKQQTNFEAPLVSKFEQEERGGCSVSRLEVSWKCSSVVTPLKQWFIKVASDLCYYQAIVRNRVNILT